MGASEVDSVPYGVVDKAKELGTLSRMVGSSGRRELSVGTFEGTIDGEEES
jgi:hypothetical protein